MTEKKMLDQSVTYHIKPAAGTRSQGSDSQNYTTLLRESMADFNGERPTGKLLGF